MGGGGQKQDTTTVHAPIRKDALPHARNVAPAKHATVFGSSLKAPGPAPSRFLGSVRQRVSLWLTSAMRPWTRGETRIVPLGCRAVV